uniref:sodium/calcium exchanger NCL2-like n=1 Tax=Erigeron canadensis TaxID=72917 RepID=UPI001CB88D0A|nr:sodium/calcium exchanger NCL2-like [Erigeron canadensis]
MSDFVARFPSYFAFILLLLSANVASRHLHYNDAKLVSDGVSDGGANSTQVEESFLHLKGMDSYEEQCNHMYGFLPCSSNLLGHICLLMIYEFLLYHAESFAGGDGRIFRVFGTNYLVSCFSQLLDALPDSAVLLASGLSTSEEKAQEYVITGAGMLAGSSILLLTLLWGVCFIYSQKEFYVKPKANVLSRVRKAKVKSQVIQQLLIDSGVLTDKETKYHAKVLFCSLIPFIFILLPRIVGLSYSSRGYKYVLLVSLVVSVLCVSFYFCYQYHQNPRIIQNRRREYAELEQKVEMNIPFYEVEALMLEREKIFIKREEEMEEELKNLTKISDKLTIEKFNDIFKKWIECTRLRMDDPSYFEESDMEYNQVFELLHENKKNLIDQISSMLERVKQDVAQDGARDGTQDKPEIYSLIQIMKTNKSGYITPGELKNIIKKVNDKELLVDDGIAEIMMRHLHPDEKGNINIFKFITGVSKLLESHKLENQSHSNNQKTQKYLSGEAKKKEKEKFWAIIWLLVGIGMLCGLAEPLVESVRELSESLKIGPFYLNFILVPLATNIRTIFAAIRAAKKKRHRTMSVTFSEIYHKVFMNNIVGFFVIVAVIFFRGLTWHFSAELLVVILVCIIMGLLGSFRTKFPNWTLFIVVPLYPLSLLVVYLVNDAFQFP